MLALFWTFLNISLLVLLLYAWVKVLKVLSRAIGPGLAVLFMLGFTFRGNQREAATSENILASAREGKPFGNWSGSSSTVMNPNNKLHLRFEGLRTDSTLQIIGMYSTVSGIMLGHEWQPLGGMAHVSGRSLIYQLDLLHTWKLLGFPLYTTSEEYQGSLSTTK